MSHINLSQIFAAGYRAISKLIIHLPTEQKGFIKDVRFLLARTVRKLFPKKSVSACAHMTGLLRSQIDDALENDAPVPVMDIESIILSELWKNRDKNNLIPINGKNDISFNTIVAKQLKCKHSAVSVMDALIKAGVVKRQGEDLLILSNAFNINHDEMRMINQMGLVMEILVDTMIYNMSAEEEKLHYQSSFKSTKIPTTVLKEYHQDVYKCSKIAMHMLRKVIEKYEVDVPNGTYPERGASIFEFDEGQTNQGETKWKM